MQQLSENFNLIEFTKSETAIRKRIDNTPNAQQVQNFNICKKILEPVRRHFNKPVRINSGYRNITPDDSVVGYSKTQYCNGNAVDNKLSSLKPRFTI
jgi:hypothetical protein